MSNFGNLLSNILDENNISVAEFSDALEVVPENIYDLLNGEFSPTMEDVDQIADVLDVDDEDLYLAMQGAAGYDREESGEYEEDDPYIENNYYYDDEEDEEFYPPEEEYYLPEEEYYEDDDEEYYLPEEEYYEDDDGVDYSYDPTTDIAFSKINELEQEVAEFKYNDAVNSKLDSLVKEAEELLYSNAMLPVEYNLLFGDLADYSEEDKIACFNASCNTNGISPETQAI
jgi:transcriptional regulator with XRE-family HTH domain